MGMKYFFIPLFLSFSLVCAAAPVAKVTSDDLGEFARCAFSVAESGWSEKEFLSDVRSGIEFQYESKMRICRSTFYEKTNYGFLIYSNQREAEMVERFLTYIEMEVQIIFRKNIKN